MPITIACPLCHGSGMTSKDLWLVANHIHAEVECPKCKGKGRIKMRIHDAISICGNISSSNYTDKEKLEAIRVAEKSVSIACMTKPKMMKLITFLLKQLDKKE